MLYTTEEVLAIAVSAFTVGGYAGAGLCYLVSRFRRHVEACGSGE